MVSRLWKLREERPRFVALSLFTLALFVVWPIVDFYVGQATDVYVTYTFNDWSAYSASLETWTSGGPVYHEAEAGGYHGSFLYPPITLLIFYPFATLGFRAGAVLMGVLSLVLLWAALVAVARTLGYEMGLVEKLVALAALFGFYPALRDFKWAQVATMLTAFLTLAFYAHELGEREGTLSPWARYASGALTTVGSSFKLFFATSGAHMLRDKRRFVGGIVAAGALLVASFAVFGVEVHRSYLDVLMWGKGWSDTLPVGYWGGNTVTSIYRPMHVLGGAKLVGKLLGVVGVIALTLAARDAEGATPRQATFALGVAVIPLLAPQAASQDLVVLLLPAMILTAIELRRESGYPSVPVLAILLVHLHRYGLGLLTNHHQLLPLGEFLRGQVAWLQPAVWGTFLLVGLAAVRVSEHATLPSALDRAS